MNFENCIFWSLKFGEAFSSPCDLLLVTLLISKNLLFSTVIQTSCPTLARPSALSKMLPWALSVSACWLYEVQWTAQIAWGVENSFVTRTLLSAKARWSSTVATLSMWNCFFSQETHGFAPTFMAHTKKWPVSRWKQPQITLILGLPIFLPSLYCT